MGTVNRPKPHELVTFLAVFAVEYQRTQGLDGLHPVHYDLMKKYGARMDAFKRAIVPDAAQKPGVSAVGTTEK